MGNRIARLNDIDGWSSIPDEQQREIHRFVVKADKNLLDGMDKAEMAAALATVGLSSPARGFLEKALCKYQGVLPALPAGSTAKGKHVAAPHKVAFNMAFDGSKSSAMWVETMAFARHIKKDYGKDLPFTYFINTAYFDPAVQGSAIGRAESDAEAKTRWALVQQAVNEGHEIADHTVRHKDGSKFTAAQWEKELREFHELMQKNLFEPIKDDHGNPVFPQWKKIPAASGAVRPPNAVEMDGCLVVPKYPIEHKGRVLFDAQGNPNLDNPDLIPYRPVGFRAPELAHNAAMYEVLERMGYTYDTSKFSAKEIGYDRMTHEGRPFDLWTFPLIKYAGSATIPMDYNYYEQKVSGDRMADDYKHSMLAAAENGRPWNIGHHFSLWNEGAYWKAMQKAIEFAAAGCPDEHGKKQAEIEFRTFGQTAADMGKPRPGAGPKPPPGNQNNS
jgi:hypothetical protein